MEYFIVALVIVAALALVILPLLRAPHSAGAGDIDVPATASERDPGTSAASERTGKGAVAYFADLGGPEPETAGSPPEQPGAPLPPPPRTTPRPTVPPPSAPQPPGEAAAEELPQAAPPPAGLSRPPGAPAADVATEEEILRYREALRAGTVCPACGTANPPGSKYCKECGEDLPTGGTPGPASA